MGDKTDFLRPGHTIVHFSNSSLLNINNLLSQMYDLAKFQPHTPITLGVMAQQQQKDRFVQQSKH